MTSPKEGSPEFYVLAVHPTSRGFGWIVFSSPATPVDWGGASARGKRSGRLIERFEKIVSRWQPDILVLEKVGEKKGSSKRLRALSGAMADLASFKGMDIALYDRNDIRAVFASDGASSRHEIAAAIATRLNELGGRLPRKRPLGSAEQHQQGLFDAAALAMTYFARREASS
jgi:Holliday junction resolvasome RuvABC endonuclease subunit